MPKLYLTLGLVAAVTAFILGAWLTRDHYKAELAQKDMLMMQLQTAIATKTREASEAARKARDDTEAAWRVKMSVAVEQSAKELENAKAKYRADLASGKRLYVRASCPVSSNNTPAGLPENSSASGGRAMETIVQLPRSVERDLHGYALDAQHAAIALASCQAAYHAIEDK